MSPTKLAFLKRIGKQIRDRRKEKDLTQEELAYEVAINASYVGRIERGEANAPIYTLKKIAKVLKLTNLQIDWASFLPKSSVIITPEHGGAIWR